MIKFEELEKLKPVRETKVEQVKQETLDENQRAEIEARIDRAIKLTRLSNIDTTEITVHLGNQFPVYLVNQVVDKYIDEGYFAAVGISNSNYNEQLENLRLEVNQMLKANNYNEAFEKNDRYIQGAAKNKNVYVNICWDQLVNKQLDFIKQTCKNKTDNGFVEVNKAVSDTDDLQALVLDSDEEDFELYTDNTKSIEEDFKWLEDFESDSWDRAIYFANKCLRGTKEEKEDYSEGSAMTVVENIVDAFLLKIFGLENSKIAISLCALVEYALESIYTNVSEGQNNTKRELTLKYSSKIINNALEQLRQLNNEETR